MALELQEAWETDDGQDGERPSDRLAYFVTGDPDPDTDNADNGQAVLAFARGAVPQAYGGNALQDVSRRRLAAGWWLVEASYSSGQFTPTGEKTFTFSTGGGSQKINWARNHVRTYQKNDSGATVVLASEYDGWINPAQGGDVDGATIDTASFEYAIGLYVHPDDMTADYVSLLYRLTNTVNATEFTATVQGVPFTFDPGECRFKGATGSLRGYGDWEITLNFVAQPNAEGVDLPGSGFTGISAKGQEHISIVTNRKVDSASSFVVPDATHVLVDAFYLEDNWTGLLLD